MVQEEGEQQHALDLGKVIDAHRGHTGVLGQDAAEGAAVAGAQLLPVRSGPRECGVTDWAREFDDNL